jgi:cell filamentation protein
MKYQLADNQNEVLPNLLRLNNSNDIGKIEFEGFLETEITLSQKLSKTTKFNSKYICDIHKLALKDLYSFAGKYRNVNVSKGGFVFPSAQFLPQSMQEFEAEILLKLPNDYPNIDLLIQDIAIVHGELLFIHPFRDGNGRTARLLANLMARKQGYAPLNFGYITNDNMDRYIKAVQQAANKNYNLMTALISDIFVV